MKSPNYGDQLVNDFQKIQAVNEAKIQNNNTLFLLISKLTTVIQINSIIAILLSILIPIFLTLQIADYTVIIVAAFFGFSLGISFAIVLIQRYLCKQVIKAK